MAKKKKYDDVLGTAMLDFAQGDQEANIRLLIDGEEDDWMKASRFFRTFDEMPVLEQIALQNCQGRILDVGAAAGCHSKWLTEKGFEVVSLDISEGACEVMKLQGIQNIVKESIFEFEDQNGFDTILMLMNGLGMSGKLSETHLLLNKLKTLLKPGGQIIGDSSDLIYLFEDEDGSYLIPSENYYGEVDFELEYKSLYSKFPWVYIDEDNLRNIAQECGLQAETLGEGDHFEFLIRFSQ